MFGEPRVLDKLVNFALLDALVFATALNFMEHGQVFFDCKKLEQNIVLRTNTHELSHLVHVFEKIDPKGLSSALCLVY